MKGSIGTATYLSYIRPYWGKGITKLNYIDKLSPQAKARYKAIILWHKYVRYLKSTEAPFIGGEKNINQVGFRV